MTENMEQANQTLPNGTIISGYRIERELGRGAMSVVYLAQQLDLQRPVALKILTEELAADKEFVKRFFNEARAAASLSHPNIIQAYDAGVAEGEIYFFCMEFVEGETLLALLEREKRMSIERSLKVAREIASALNYGFQRARFTHGDIKPDNIILNQLDQAKLADFGLAKVEGHDFDGSEIMLTPLYAPPELIRGERRSGDCRSDIYAFGATIYHLIAGSPPFPGAVASEVLDRHLHENPEPLRLRYSKTPLGLSDFISRMLSKTPEQRPQNWEEVLYNLRQCQQYLTHVAGGASPVKAKKPLFIKPVTVDAPPTDAAPAAVNNLPRHKPRSPFSMVTALIFGCLFLLACLSAILLLRRPATAVPVPVAVSTTDVPATSSSETDLVDQEDNANAIATAVRADEDATDHDKTVTATEDPPSTDALSEAGAPDQHEEQTPQDKVIDQPEQTAQEQTGDGADEPTVSVTPTAMPQFSLRLPQIAIPLPVLPEQLAQEAWIEAAQCLAQLSYDLNHTTPAEPMMRGVMEWRQQRTDDNDATNFMQFIHDTALPALEELNVKIVQNKELLEGQIFRNRRRETVSIANVAFAGLEVDKVLPGGKGKYRQKLSWEQAKNEGLLEELGRKVFLPDKSNLSQIRPFLAYLAFTGRSQEIPRLLQQLQRPATSPEYRHWTMLPKIEAWASKTEAEALKQWRRLQKSCENGNALLAHETATRLRRGNTVTAGLYSRQLEDVIRRCAPQVPQQHAGELLRQAQTSMQQNNYATALEHLLLAQARYGNIEYPEKSGLETRLANTLHSLPASEWLETDNPSLVQWLPFFLPRDIASWPAWAFVADREGVFQNLLPRQKEGAEQIADWVQLELGNWNYAYHQLARKQSELQVPDDPAIRMATLFGNGMLLERLANDEQKVELIFAQLLAEANANRGAGYLEKLSLAYRYAVLTRQCHLLNASEMARQRPDVSAPTAPAASLLASYFIIAALEAGDTALAYTTLTDLTPFQDVLFPNLPPLDPSVDDFPANVTFSLAHFPAQPPVHLLRLLLSCTTTSSFSASSDQAFQELAAASCAGWPLDGGELIFSWLMRRCGDLVAVGDLSGAAEMVDWCLSLTGSCLYPYYSRLHFLKAGLHLLSGSNGALEAGVIYVNAATVVSDTEKRFLQSVTRPDALATFMSRLSPAHPGQFWFHWLTLCLGFSSEADATTLATNFAAWKPHARTVAERHFQTAMDDYLQHIKGE